jgi:hypothetical protein
MSKAAFGKQTLTLALLLCAVSCITRTALDFRVVPAAPNYLLRSPDSQETPFPDILRSYNGFEPGREWVDLRPGMGLGIENAYYQPGMPRRGLDGFLGTEKASYKVRSRGLQLLSVQPMKDRPSGQPPVQQLIRPFAMHYHSYRFYYEIFFRRSDNVRGSVLLGANTKSDLDRIGAELLKNPEVTCGESSRDCVVFPEACSLSIEMEIVVNGVPKNVIWGSDLKSVVGGAQHVELSRIHDGRLVPVTLDAGDPNALRLPLLPGDHVKYS